MNLENRLRKLEAAALATDGAWLKLIEGLPVEKQIDLLLCPDAVTFFSDFTNEELQELANGNFTGPAYSKFIRLGGLNRQKAWDEMTRRKLEAL